MEDNILKCFEYVERRNNDDIAKKIGQIRVDGNRGRGGLKKKQIGVIKENIKAYRVYKNMVRDRVMWMDIIRLTDPPIQGGGENKEEEYCS